MPHSSGGGSHGGGSHGGSHSSSRSGSGSSSSARSMPRTRRTYFKGATPYVLYKNGKANVIYADKALTKPDKEDYIFTFAFIGIITVFMGFFLIMAFSSLFPSLIAPEKLATNYNTAIVIEDNLGIINDKSDMEKALEDFLDTTGISPAIITVTNESWHNYSTLENYAYDLYVNRFDDEKHWLIVYSQPASPDPEFNDWYWEGMQGDDTDNIITEYYADMFNGKLQQYLTANTKYSAEEAIRKAFEETTPVIMQRHIGKEEILNSVMPLGIVCLMWLVPMGIMLTQLVKMKKYSKYEKVSLKTPVRSGVIQDKCDYCDGVYIVGSCLSCPHCGASIKPHNIEYDV